MEHQDDELLDNYWLGRLDENARQQVEQRAKQDEAFARELAFRRVMVRGIELSGEAPLLREQFTSVEASLRAEGFFEEKRPALRFVLGGLLSQNRFKWAAAASVAVFLAAATWVFWQQKPEPSEIVVVQPKPDSTQQAEKQQPNDLNSPTPLPQKERPANNRYLAIAREAYSAPDFSSFRTTETAAPTLLSKASKAYEKGDFPLVIQLLNTVSTASPFYWQALEMQAHTNFQLGKTDAATGQFRLLAQSNRPPVSELSEWFWLLCLTENYPATKREFEALSRKILSDSGHPYFEETRALSQKLRLKK